jgi:hypothetical protein
MTTEQARAMLLKHDDALRGGPDDERDNLLANLRPYECVKGRHLAEIVAALHTLAPELASGPSMDRGAIHSTWDLCRTARIWTRGPREPMFHGSQFIPPDRKRLLDDWIDEIEAIAINLARSPGLEGWLTFAGVSWLILKHQLRAEAACLVPLLVEVLEGNLANESRSADAGDAVYACQALASIGPPARDSIGLLRRLAEETRFEELRSAADHAITQIDFDG